MRLLVNIDAQTRAATVRERLCAISPGTGSAQPLPYGRGSDFHGSDFRGSDRRAGFTIVELIVVVVVIALILAIALPGLSAMTNDARFSAAVQSINGALNRARIESLADMNMTAVRFVRADWDAESGGQTATLLDRQHVVGFRYRLDSQDPSNPSDVLFDERFERRPESQAVVLPAGIWAAPAEALESGRTEILDGRLHDSFVQAPQSPGAGGFLSADDFLIVFNPQSGVLGSGRPSAPTRFDLLAYNANTNKDDPDVERSEPFGSAMGVSVPRGRYSRDGQLV